MCMVEGCERKPVAKGMCAKHYMRERRTGDPGAVGTPGRKRSWRRLQMEELGMEREWSPRSFARFKQGMEMLEEVCHSEEEMAGLVAAATRPNGKLNVSKLQEIAFVQYAVRVNGASQSDAEVAWVIWKATH